MKRKDLIRLLNSNHKAMIAEIESLDAYEGYKWYVHKEDIENILETICAYRAKEHSIINDICSDGYKKTRKN